MSDYIASLVTSLHTRRLRLRELLDAVGAINDGTSKGAWRCWISGPQVISPQYCMLIDILERWGCTKHKLEYCITHTVLRTADQSWRGRPAGGSGGW